MEISKTARKIVKNSLDIAHIANRKHPAVRLQTEFWRVYDLTVGIREVMDTRDIGIS